MDKLSRKTVGELGENIAVKFLKKNKYKILTTNYSTKFGEIDIICENKEYIVFVEVKTRKKDSMVSGVYAVDKEKQRHIFNVADAYLKAYKKVKQPRFDIIEIEFDEQAKNGTVKNHYSDAFIQGGEYAVF